ncbi:hypothetical protein B0T25DRAFT_198941 [Lasiosphaeria hispida]|uniref:Uncharacterized protein n=1 Tax=Lasiosphaeria hispida TaxID=260671 RepID=A0AAJ0ME08_9PEZI|nr:hypothetical protein B0T25DRAFT_198941 [Lasiosphaeria hispida]
MPHLLTISPISLICRPPHSTHARLQPLNSSIPQSPMPPIPFSGQLSTARDCIRTVAEGTDSWVQHRLGQAGQKQHTLVARPLPAQRENGDEALYKAARGQAPDRIARVKRHSLPKTLDKKSNRHLSFANYSWRRTSKRSCNWNVGNPLHLQIPRGPPHPPPPQSRTQRST